MALNLSNFDKKARQAVKLFWKSRDDAKLKQKGLGRSDQGERAGVTGGKNMNGFFDLMIDLGVWAAEGKSLTTPEPADR